MRHDRQRVRAMPSGEVAVTVLVTMPVERAFSTFTDDIDRWWRRPPGETADAVVRFEHDRLVAVSAGGAEVVATVTEWSPPSHLVLDWQGPHAEPGDRVRVEFAAEADGTRVTVIHR